VSEEIKVIGLHAKEGLLNARGVSVDVGREEESEGTVVTWIKEVLLPGFNEGKVNKQPRCRWFKSGNYCMII